MSICRTAREFYNKFGKTAEKYNLEEEPFCGWLMEVKKLVDKLSPESNQKDIDDKIESNFESLNSEIRDRVQLKQRLEANRTEAQQEFQQRLEKIRGKPDEIVNQYIECGNEIKETDNYMFPYIWYALGDKMVIEALLGQKSGEIYGEYKYWSGKREEQESNLDSDDIVVGMEQIESALE
jgi:hypothetical protein